MKNIATDIFKQAEEHVTELYNSSPQNNLVYHSIDHTRAVVDHANEIASHYELTEKEIIILNIAAWFHDTGHIYTGPAGHEEKSVEIMKTWLEGKDIYEALADDISRTIMATKMETKPSGILQEIIKDADTYHFGTKGFKKKDKLMKKEMKLRNLNTILLEWDKNTLAILENHIFYTDYCKTRLEERKQKNIEKVKKEIDLVHSPNSSDMILPDGEGDKKDAKQTGIITKGIQTMLRLSSENHMRLSDMADNKANILLSVNAIIISVILSVLVRKIEVDKYLTIPTMIFLASSLATVVIAILSTRPKITNGNFTREDVLNRKTNLLFFGNFFKANLDEYKWAMSTMMRDPNYLYSALVDDIYYLGKVLGRKYRLVRIAYSVFMVGMVASALAFIIATLFHNASSTGPAIVDGTSPF